MEKPSYLRHMTGPVSLEAERQRAMKIVHRVEKMAGNFDRNWIRDASDDYVDSWLQFIEFATTNAGMKRCTTTNAGNRKRKSYDVFGEELKQMRTHVAMTSKRKDIDQMERVVDRAKLFDNLLLEASEKLRNVLENLVAKYCLSFAYEGAEQELDSVIEYENSINDWTEKVQNYLDRLQTLDMDMREQEGFTIESYIRNYGKVLHYMSLILEIIPKICNIFKDWVIADEAYPRKLQQEMNGYQQEKDEIAEVIRRRQNQRDEAKSRLQRAGYDSKKIQEHIQWTISERKQCRKRELAHQDEIDILEEDIAEKGAEFEKLSHELTLHSKNPPREFLSLAGKLDSESRDIVQMKRELKGMKNRLNKMKLNRYDVQKDLYKTKSVFEKSVKKVKRIKSRAKKDHNTTEKLKTDLKVVTSKVNALNRIKKIKTDPMTVKRIHFEGYLPHRVGNLSGE